MEEKKKGANRQEIHEILRKQAILAYEVIEKGDKNPFTENLKKETKIKKYLSTSKIEALMDYKNHTGLASKKAQETVHEIRNLA